MSDQFVASPCSNASDRRPSSASTNHSMDSSHLQSAQSSHCIIPQTQNFALEPTHLPLSRQPSDPFLWGHGLDNLKTSQSIRNNPEFQEILCQLQRAESFGWNISEQNQSQLAASLSEILFRSMKDRVDAPQMQ